MEETMTRRKTLTAAAVAPVVSLFSKEAFSAASHETGSGRESFWWPGPDRNLVRDLKPWATPIRLANYVVYDGKISPGDWVKAIRDSGLTAAAVPPDPWGTVGDSVIRELKAALAQHDVEIFEVCGYCNILHTEETARQKNLHHVARCVEVAERIGCRAVATVSGSRNHEENRWLDNYAVHPDNWTMATWNILLDGIRQILRETSGMKAAIALEAQVTTNIDGPLAHKRLIEDIGDPRFKVMLDPINMVTWNNYYHTAELINECFDLLGENIVGCHGKDTVALIHEQTLHIQELCTGRGIFDHEMYLVRMSRMQWPRSIWPDHIPAEQMPEAYAYIRKTAERVGVKIY